MASVNKKKKAKNSYLYKANKTTDKLKRVNFYNKKDRKLNKDYDNIIWENFY